MGDTKNRSHEKETQQPGKPLEDNRSASSPSQFHETRTRERFQGRKQGHLCEPVFLCKTGQESPFEGKQGNTCTATLVEKIEGSYVRPTSKRPPTRGRRDNENNPPPSRSKAWSHHRSLGVHEKRFEKTQGWCNRGGKTRGPKQTQRRGVFFPFRALASCRFHQSQLDEKVKQVPPPPPSSTEQKTQKLYVSN